jgi:Cdc6-like AAA superfamily ATPase
VGRDAIRDQVRIAIARIRAGKPEQSVILVGLCGVGKTVLLEQMRALAGNAKSYAERLFKYPNIGALSDTDATLAIIKPAEDLNVFIELEDVQMIVRPSQGYPNFLQEWAKQAWNAASGATITVKDTVQIGLHKLSFPRKRESR